MRLVIISAASLLAAGCASAPTAEDTTAVERACTTTDCFRERDVRDFEVIDRTTLIVYVGAERCAFRLELTGTFCDMTFAPELFFSSPNELRDDSSLGSSRRIAGPGGLGTDAFDRDARSSDLRVCANDLGISVDGGVFTESAGVAEPPNRFGNRRSQCQVSGVAPLTDDQLVELYVNRGVTAPPPPMGSGEIEVGEQPEEPPAAESPPTEATGAARPDPSTAAETAAAGRTN